MIFLNCLETHAQGCNARHGRNPHQGIRKRFPFFFRERLSILKTGFLFGHCQVYNASQCIEVFVVKLSMYGVVLGQNWW